MKSLHRYTFPKLTPLAIGLFVLLHSGSAGAGEAKGTAQAEWERTLQAARKEGQVTIYGSEVYDGVFRHFQKRYPEIKVVAVVGGGNRLVHRAMGERRAGQFLIDLYLSGSGTAHDVLLKAEVLDPVKPMLLIPEVVDQSKWWQGRHKYVDAQGEYIFAFNGLSQSYFQYNVKMVDPKEFKSYWDFLNPKWKGKILIMDPTSGGGVTGVLRFLYRNQDLGPEFLRRFLAEMDLGVTRDLRQYGDWLAAGRFPIAGFASADRAELFKAKEQGLPVDWFDPRIFKEGAPLSSSNGNLALMNRAPHPNAAKVAINWLLSREGQMVYQSLQEGADSLRNDISKEAVPSSNRRWDGVKYEIMDNPEWRDMEPVLKVVNEVWKKRK
jgi:iron(III) transport system substrate-binding protein